LTKKKFNNWKRPFFRRQARSVFLQGSFDRLFANACAREIKPDDRIGRVSVLDCFSKVQSCIGKIADIELSISESSYGAAPIILLALAGVYPAYRVDDASDRIVLATAAIEGLESGRTRDLELRILEVWAESRYDDFLRYKEWCRCFDTDARRRYWDRLVEDRNRIMALGIDALHEKGHSVFAAVGYAHMVGDRGLPGLLEQMGYQVEFVVFAKRG
jgi:TraB/PrgY/gumN family